MPITVCVCVCGACVQAGICNSSGNYRLDPIIGAKTHFLAAAASKHNQFQDLIVFQDSMNPQDMIPNT